MCAPGSKHHVHLNRAFFQLCILFVYSVSWLLHSYWDATFELLSLNANNSKWYASPEVIEDIGALQAHVGALVHSDLRRGIGTGTTYVEAAFDLISTNSSQAFQGRLDWEYFLLPSNVATAALKEMPADWRNVHFPSLTPLVLHGEYPTLAMLGIKDGSTITLASYLRGGAPKVLKKPVRNIIRKSIRTKTVKNVKLKGKVGCPFPDTGKPNGICGKRCRASAKLDGNLLRLKVGARFQIRQKRPASVAKDAESSQRRMASNIARNMPR